MVQLDKRVLWHPRHNNRFIVGGSSQITLYEWAAEFPEIRHVTAQHDLHHMKCFAWSPDPAFEDLLAVGSSMGKVDLIRLEATKQARQTNLLVNGPNVTLPVRHNRNCNAVAFCAKDPNYLAVGLDKIRNDSSLIIWDISSIRPTLSIESLDADNDQSSTSVLPSRPQPQIPRLDNRPDTRADSRILQQHALTDVVSSVSFLPDSTHLLLAGVSYRWLRLFDLRSATPAVTNVASKVHGIATDPFDAHRVACFGDNTVTIWDYRKLSQPLLLFSERDASADGARLRQGQYAHIEFSNVRRGCLATLERESSYVRFWDIAETRTWGTEASLFGGSSDGEGKPSREATRVARRSWANLPWPSGQQNAHSPKANEIPGNSSHRAYVLADTRRTKTFPRPISSFTVVPDLNIKTPLTSSVMVVNKEGDLELYRVYDTPKQANWSSRGEFVMGAAGFLKFVEGCQDDDLFDELQSDTRRPSSSHQKYANSERASRSRSGAGRDDHPLHRGRPPKPSHPPASALFARDEDTFPSLSGVSAQLAKTYGRNASRGNRGYSPASFRKYNERGEVTSRAPSRPPPNRPLRDRKPGSRSRERTLSPGAGKRTIIGGPPGRPFKGVTSIIQEDISMLMRRRALRGYSLAGAGENSTIVLKDQDPSDSTAQSLSEIWAWVHHSTEVLTKPTSKLHGYDFAYKGILGIWEGFQPFTPPNSADDTPIATQRSLLLDVPGSAPSVHHAHTGSSGGGGLERQASRRGHSLTDDLFGNWNAALAALVERRGADKSTWKPSVPTTKLSQRQIALQLCGWSLREDELKAAVKRWEKEGNISRAACWLVFSKHYAKAIDVLMRSPDEMHRLMSGTIAALTLHSSSALKNPELREHYSRMTVRLEDPYFRMMITHMGVGDWLEVLEEDTIPFRERLAIAVQFLEDRSLTSYLHRMTVDASQTGNIDAIIVTGLTKSGLDILQAYVDRTGDVQTAAIIGSYACPIKFQDRRVEKWLDAYRDLLDGFKLYHERVGFDILRGQELVDAIQNGDMVANHLVPPQILIRCHYCNKSINSGEGLSIKDHKARPTTCPHCSRSLPKCSVCLMTLAIADDASREMELTSSQYKDTIDDAIVICQTCRHGGHASHILEWFLGEDGRRADGMCPVANCECRCADEL